MNESNEGGLSRNNNIHFRGRNFSTHVETRLSPPPPDNA